MPDADAEIVHWRSAEPDETPRGATTVANAARKAGFAVRAYYSRGPWVTNKELGEDEEAGICEMIAITGRLNERRFRATWHRKLWTKAATYGFAGAQIWPPREGATLPTKHPESPGDKTIGGLKNSKTLNTYLKES